MMVFNDNVFSVIALDFLAVDFGAGILALPQGADVEVIVQDTLHRHNCPRGLTLTSAGFAISFLTHLLGRARRGNTLCSQVVRDLLIASSVVVIETKNLSHDLSFRGNNFKFLMSVHKISVRYGKDPLPILLTAFDDVPHLFGGVGDRHLIDEKLELHFQPVIIIWDVNIVANRDDAHAGILQIFQFHRTTGASTGKAGEILDDQDAVLVAHESLAHDLVTLALLKGAARVVTVLIKCQVAAGKPLLYEILNDGFLVLDGYIVPVELIIDGNTPVACNAKSFQQCHYSLKQQLQLTLYHSFAYIARLKENQGE